MDPWPFDDPPNTAAITLERIIRGASAVRLVTHDADDGAWQFLDDEHVSEEDAMLVSLAHLLHFDPSLATVADLPLGWYARRARPGSSWHRAPGDPPAAPEVPGG